MESTKAAGSRRKRVLKTPYGEESSEGAPVSTVMRVAVLVAILRSSNAGYELLLLRQPSGRFVLPGGPIELSDHSLEEAGNRVVLETTGQPPSGQMMQVRAFEQHLSHAENRAIWVLYMTFVSAKVEAVEALREVAQWFHLKRLPRPVAADHDRLVRSLFLPYR